MSKKLGILEKIKKIRRDQWMVLLLAGILSVVLSLPYGNRSSSVETQTETEADIVRTTDVYDMEKRLESILCKMQGAGEVRVMITRKDNGEKIVEKDRQSNSRTTQEEGTSRSSVEQENQEATVYTQNGSGQGTPYVTQELAPQVEGVLVLAQGGDNANVKKDITDAVMALFGLEAHKIKVMKME